MNTDTPSKWHGSDTRAPEPGTQMRPVSRIQACWSAEVVPQRATAVARRSRTAAETYGSCDFGRSNGTQWHDGLRASVRDHRRAG